MSTLPKIIDHALYGDLCAYIKFDNEIEVWVASEICRIREPKADKYRDQTKEEEVLAAKLDWHGPTREMTYREIKNLQLICFEEFEKPFSKEAYKDSLAEHVSVACKDERKRFNAACMETLSKPVFETYNGKYYVDKVTDEWYYCCRRVPGQTGGMRGVDRSKMEERSWLGSNNDDWVSLLAQLKVPRNTFFL